MDTLYVKRNGRDFEAARQSQSSISRCESSIAICHTTTLRKKRKNLQLRVKGSRCRHFRLSVLQFSRACKRARNIIPRYWEQTLAKTCNHKVSFYETVVSLSRITRTNDIGVRNSETDENDKNNEKTVRTFIRIFILPLIQDWHYDKLEGILCFFKDRKIIVKHNCCNEFSTFITIEC